MKAKAYSLTLIIVLISFLGFITENIFICFRSGVIDNRNMVLPFLLGYGLAILAIYKLFGTPNEPKFLGKELHFSSSFIAIIYYFVIAFLCVSIGELILGHLIEWTCGIKWWNYSSLPLHITQYTSVLTSSLFALFITVFMKLFFNPLLNSFQKINPKVLPILAISLMFLLSVDFIHSAIYMFKNHQTLQIWKIEFSRPLKEIFINMKGSN